MSGNTFSSNLEISNLEGWRWGKGDWKGGRGSRRIEGGIEDRERGRARAWEVVGGNGG